MEEILKYTGIGGLALSILFILFKDIIRKNIFPQLNQVQAYKILRLIIILVFCISIFSIAIYFFLSKPPETSPQIKTTGSANTSIIGNNNAVTNLYNSGGMPLFDENKLPIDSLSDFLANHDGREVELILTLDDLNKNPLPDTTAEGYTKYPYGDVSYEKVDSTDVTPNESIDLSSVSFILYNPADISFTNSEGKLCHYYIVESGDHMTCNVDVNDRNKGFVYLKYGAIFIKGTYRVNIGAGHGQEWAELVPL